MSAPDLILGKTRDFYTVTDSHYVYDCLNKDGCLFEVTRVRRDQYGELRCLLDVRTSLAGAMTLDEAGTLARYDQINLSAVTSRKITADDLQRRSRSDDIDFRSLLDQLSFKVSVADSKGQDAEWLADVPRRTSEPIYTVDGFPILRDHPQIVFGDGGTLKSYLMLYWAGLLAKQGVRVMYSDWELDKEDHKERLAAIFGGNEPKILYVKCTRPLVHELERLSRLKFEHQIQFNFCDSIAFACHGKPEDAQVAQEYLRACRSLGIGSLHSAHITGSTDSREHRPFGSVFWHNGARATWFVTGDDSKDQHTRTVALINRKVNLSGPKGARAFKFDFEPNHVRIAKADPTSVETAVAKIPTWQRIKAAISRCPLTYAELAGETGIKESTIRKSVERGTNTFRVIEGGNGVQKVGLLDRFTA